MASDRRTSELKEHQKFIAAALTDEPKTLEQLCNQAEQEGYLDTISKPHWKLLVQLGYAVVVTDDSGKILGLKRGPQWQVFYQRYGSEVTRKGLDYRDVCDEIDSLITGLNLAPCFEELRNEGPSDR